ncbi:class III lanthionine synthetase LanKC [Streptomyces varsoviensis]|uniref:class III lanthionine synthetase LanKC n=1 Tax=Streptomyces varsoviensis TaxID=67373 RepID=UPI0033D77481
MDQRYQEFCLTDPEFYEAPGPAGGADEFEANRREPPPGWQRIELAGWRSYAPPDVRIPAQGWKVHVSAVVADAAEVAGVVREYCVARRLPFKIVTGPHEWVMKNSKYAPREGSGKLATLYPADETELLRTLEELGALLDGRPGPYILSDLRWRDGPLYVRYGSFLHRPFVDASGAVRSGIENPRGQLEADPRGPVFRTPDWVRLPSFLRPELARRNETTVDDFPYEIVRALHFSNGGGVYEAKDPATGRRLIVKEARPHAGLDAAHQDAVTRLRAERDILRTLSGLPCVPAVVDYRRLGENEFLVEEFIEGTTLNNCYAQRSPLGDAGRTREELAAYGRWAERVTCAVASALDSVHARGIVHGDLHPFNIMMQEGQGEGAEGEPRAVLLDFEVARSVDSPRRPTLEHPGFGAPPDRHGFDPDRYALAALRLALYVPLTTLVRLRPAKAAQLADLVAEAFGVPRAYFEAAVAVLAPTRRQKQEPAQASRRRPIRTPRPMPAPTPSPGPATKPTRGASGAACAAPERECGRIELDSASWPRLRASLAGAIAASATPARADRLFPGDIEQFTGVGGVNLAHGAAGVLWALRASGAQEYAEGTEWLAHRVRHIPAPLPPGFYDGAHGIAHSLWELGDHDGALTLLDRLAGADLGHLDHSLYSGLAGIGLNWLAFARWQGDGSFLRRAEQTAALLRRRIEEWPERPAGVGLMRGASGPALLMSHMYEASGDAAWLDAAAAALRHDLARCVHDAWGVLHVDDGRRTLPYLNSGSVGIGFALRHYLAHRHEPFLAESLRAIGPASRSGYYVFSGLFNGRAGMVLFNAAAGPDAPANAVADQVRGLNWHVLQWRGHTAFPGDQLLRLSMDLASGGAGVLLALAAAHGVRHDGRPVSLPFLR